MVPNMPVPIVIIPMEVISMSSLAKKEKIILVTCVTRILKEIITLIIWLTFYNFVKQLARQHLFKMFNLVIYSKEIN